jgi:hypothetical protein
MVAKVKKGLKFKVYGFKLYNTSYRALMVLLLRRNPFIVLLTI